MTSEGATARTRTRSGSRLQPRQFPSLDGYRALAAIAVLTTHVGFQTGQTINGPFGGAVARLEVGVSLFFLLSGFLLYRPHARAAMVGISGPSTIPYLWRRALRVLPAYWVAVTAALLLVRGNEVNRSEPVVWIRQLLLLQVYGENGLVPGLTQMWSLCVEVTFYLALPALAAGLTARDRGHVKRSARLQLGLLAALAVIAWAWQIWVRGGRGPDSDIASLWLPAYLDWFAVGMAFAVAHCYLTLLPRSQWGRAARILTDVGQAPWTCWAAAGGLYLVAITPLAGPVTLDAAPVGPALLRHILYGVIAALLLLPGLMGAASGPGRTLASPVMRWLGDISYGIFLYHLVVLDLVFVVTGRAFFTGGFWQVWVLTLTATVVLSALSWYLLESPLLRLKSRGPGRDDPPSAPHRRPGRRRRSRRTARPHR